MTVTVSDTGSAARTPDVVVRRRPGKQQRPGVVPVVGGLGRFGADRRVELADVDLHAAPDRRQHAGVRLLHVLQRAVIRIEGVDPGCRRAEPDVGAEADPPLLGRQEFEGGLEIAERELVVVLVEVAQDVLARTPARCRCRRSTCRGWSRTSPGPGTSTAWVPARPARRRAGRPRASRCRGAVPVGAAGCGRRRHRRAGGLRARRASAPSPAPGRRAAAARATGRATPVESKMVQSAQHVSCTPSATKVRASRFGPTTGSSASIR